VKRAHLARFLHHEVGVARRIKGKRRLWNNYDAFFETVA
jgi:hypothetical protein